MRDWIGTPFVWGQSQKGLGCDCKGLVLGVLRERGWDQADSYHATFAGYRDDRPVPSAFLMEAMEQLFDRVEVMEAGDVLILTVHGRPAHMALYVGDGRAMHAVPLGEVRERDLSIITRKFPLHSVWRCR